MMNAQNLHFHELHHELCMTITKYIKMDPDKEYVFSSCRNHIVLLKKISMTDTNEQYIHNVSHPENIVYRGTNFMVVLIINKFNPSFALKRCTRITSLFDTIIFSIGDIVNDELYYFHERNLLYSAGIYFCKTLETAFYNAEIPHGYTGPWKSWHENGELHVLECFIDGNKEGFFRYYHNNGVIHAEGSYKNGNKTKKWKYWDKMGNKINSPEHSVLDIML
jgi:hypothetical protein